MKVQSIIILAKFIFLSSKKEEQQDNNGQEQAQGLYRSALTKGLSLQSKANYRAATEWLELYTTLNRKGSGCNMKPGAQAQPSSKLAGRTIFFWFNFRPKKSEQGFFLLILELPIEMELPWEILKETNYLELITLGKE